MNAIHLVHGGGILVVVLTGILSVFAFFANNRDLRMTIIQHTKRRKGVGSEERPTSARIWRLLAMLLFAVEVYRMLS